MTVDVIPHSTGRLVTVECDSTASRADRARAIVATVRGRGWEKVATRYSETYGFLHRTAIIYRIPRELGCDKCMPIGHGMPGYIALRYWDDEGPYECIARCYTCNHRDR